MQTQNRAAEIVEMDNPGVYYMRLLSTGKAIGAVYTCPGQEVRVIVGRPGVPGRVAFYYATIEGAREAAAAGAF